MCTSNSGIQEGMVNHLTEDIPHTEDLEAVAASQAETVAEDSPVVDPEDSALRVDPLEEVLREVRLLPDHQKTLVILMDIGVAISKEAISHNILGHGMARAFTS